MHLSLVSVVLAMHCKLCQAGHCLLVLTTAAVSDLTVGCLKAMRYEADSKLAVLVMQLSLFNATVNLDQARKKRRT